MTDLFHGKTFWLIGASEGLGRALALKLADAGARVVASARSAERLADLAQTAGISAQALDVMDPDSVRQAAAQIGPVDGVIYCAGAYEPVTAQNWDADAVERMAEVNFNGALRVLGQVVPDMAARDAGHIVLVGSLAGFRGLPGAIGYGASKAALMHLGETLRADLRGTGVQVQLANPGFINTRLTQKNNFDMPQLMTPDSAADHVMRAMQSGRFSTSFPRPFAWIFTLGQYLPIRWFQAMMPQR